MQSLPNYKYQAFISYKREDEKWASWLQRKLEHYKIPAVVMKTNASLPSYVRPVFKDTTDLSGGVLEKAIDEALCQSRYLIVICSPRAAQSPWVCKEVQHFIDAGKEEFIIPFIIEGLPNSSDLATECFPKNLQELTGSRELLGININEMGRDAAMVKVVARMFRLEFDTLWRRFEREKRRKFYWGIILAMLLVLAAVSVAGLIYKKNTELHHQYELIEEQNFKLDSTNILVIKSNDSLAIQHSRLLLANEELNRQYELIEEQSFKLDSTNILITKSNDSLAIQHSLLLQTNEELNRQQQMLNEEYENVKRANRGMKINNARYISSLIRSLTDDGEVYDAHRLSGEIYRRLTSEGIDVPEVESAMRYSFSARPSFTKLNNEISPCPYIPVKTFDADIYNCEFGRFADDASVLMIYGSKGFGGIFDTSTGQILQDISYQINNNDEFIFNEFTISRSWRFSAVSFSYGDKELIAIADNITKEYHILESGNGVVYMTFSPDERYLAYMTQNGLGSYAVIDAQEGKFVGSGEVISPVSSLLFSSDSKRLYLASLLLDDVPTCIDVLKNKVYKLNIIDKPFDRLKFDNVLCVANGRLYASNGRKLYIINEADMKVVDTISDHEGLVCSATLFDERLLIIGDDSGLIYIWDLESTPTLKQRLKLHNAEITHIAIDNSGDWILTCSEDHTAKLLGKLNYLEPYDYGHIEDFRTMTSINTSSVVIAKDYSICEMSLEDGKIIWESELPKWNIYSKVACHNGNELIAVPASDNTILLYRNGKMDDVLYGHSGKVVDLSFNCDGSRLASVTSYDDKLIIWDIANNMQEEVLEVPSSLGNPVNGVAFSKDGKYLLLFAEKEARVYETSGWTYSSLKVKSEAIQVAAISPIGTRAIICKDNQEVVIWDFADERSLMTVRWQKIMTGVAFSHSGAYVAATSDDGWLKVWDVTTGDSVMEYHICSGPCENPQFMIDDTAVLCHDYEGFYLVNLYGTQEYVDYINDTYGSYQLTPDELKQFYLE